MVRRASVLTHRRLAQTRPAVHALVEAACRAGVALHVSREEAGKHDLAGRDGIVVEDAELAREVDVCVVLGGDGTILSALRHYADTEVPVFAVNYGEVGFLATVDPDGGAGHFHRALASDFETLRLPAVSVSCGQGGWIALNDVSVHRKPGHRVADLAYGFDGEELGRVRCDGLVVATPQGSTGYNLANGGPVLAWGVEGYVVSFISPHSFTARPLVVAPDDELAITNASREESVEVYADGRPVADIEAGQAVRVAFGRSHALLAQLPGASFYHRLGERFGRLAR